MKRTGERKRESGQKAAKTTIRPEPGGRDHCSEMKGTHLLIQHKV